MLVWRMMKIVNLPPPVTRSANQVMTIEELLEHAKNESMGKSMTTKKQ